MKAVTWTSERGNIAHRCGFDDGPAAMRETIKGLMLENERLRKPIMDGSHPAVVKADRTISRIRFVYGRQFDRCASTPARTERGHDWSPVLPGERLWQPPEA